MAVNNDIALAKNLFRSSIRDTKKHYLLQRLEILGDRLGELDGALQRAIEDSFRALATEAVQFALSSLWSRIPDVPVEEAMEGIVQGYKDEAHARTLSVAREVVNTFAPMAAGGPPAGDGADPEAQPEDLAEGADTGQ